MMASTPTKYKVTIFGEAYTVISDETEADILAIAQGIDATMKELAQRSPGLETYRLAVFAALSCALESAKLKKELALQTAYHEQLVTIITRELAL